MATATLLLPARARFGAQRLSSESGLRLARADLTRTEGTQVARVFDVLPRGWPVAAATRQRDVGDAGKAMWVRADPAYIRPDINGARLLAHGEALALTEREVAGFLQPLKPLFGDCGFLIDAPTPSRWYLQLPAGARVPEMAGPDEALGAELFDQIPASAPGHGDEGRRWRALLSEAQVLLHNHPRNAERIAAGLAPVNSLWFWGSGVLPDHVRTSFTEVLSDDDAMSAFAGLAGVAATPPGVRWVGCRGDTLVDQRHVRDLVPLQAAWLLPMLEDLAGGRLDRVTLDFADDVRYVIRARQRWRFWRKPLRSLIT